MVITRIIITIMARTAGQDPAHTGPALGVAAQIMDIKDKVIRLVIISSRVRVTSNSSQDIKVI